MNLVYANHFNNADRRVRHPAPSPMVLSSGVVGVRRTVHIATSETVPVTVTFCIVPARRSRWCGRCVPGHLRPRKSWQALNVGDAGEVTDIAVYGHGFGRPVEHRQTAETAHSARRYFLRNVRRSGSAGSRYQSVLSSAKLILFVATIADSVLTADGVAGKVHHTEICRASKPSGCNC